MLVTVVLAGALAAGVPLVEVGALAALWLFPPWPIAVVVAALAILQRRPRDQTPDPEVAFLHGVAAELRSGASPRLALAAARSRSPELDVDSAVRLAIAGQATSAVASELRRGLPLMGRHAAAAFRLSAGAGARAARVFETLAQRAEQLIEQRREQRVLVAQARLSAAVVAGVPLCLVVLLAYSGRLSAVHLGEPAGLTVAAAGAALLTTGIATVAWMSRRLEPRR